MFRAVVAEEESSKTRRTRRMKSASSSFSSVIIFYVVVVTVFVSLGVFVDGREFEHRRASFGRGSSLETTIQTTASATTARNILSLSSTNCYALSPLRVYLITLLKE